MERLRNLYEKLTGRQAEVIEKLAGAGSNRIYYRVGEYVGVIGTSEEENRAFCEISRVLHDEGVNVPVVYAHSDDYMVYLEEDLGDVMLYDAIRKGRESGGRYSEDEVALLRKVMGELPKIQFAGGKEAVFANCYPQREMDHTSVMFDLNYFKYCFLKLSGVEFNEIRLQEDFESFAADILASASNVPTFMCRDFQARNVMLRDGKPYFIDFQGGRKGPIYYDVASFLWQSSACYSDSLREQLIDTYLESLGRYVSVTREEFVGKLHLFVLFRLLQVLGAYGFRGLWEKKTYFVNSIPSALANLKTEIERGVCDAYPYIKEVCCMLISKMIPTDAKADSKVSRYLSGDSSYLGKSDKPLVVRVFSFSFKKGIPSDETTNGGGYVFDCRSTHNPGRYDEYKSLTGLDAPVIEFLEEDGEILTFLDSVYKLVDFHVRRFMDRGFTDLMISCGCTGGRHRSVYSAQHVAEHLQKKFGVEVRVCHREIGVSQVL